jgi:hypothetical protein
MSVAILSPLDGDTVVSPVTVSTSYSFNSGTFTLTDSVGANTDPNPPAVSGVGVYNPAILVPVTVPTVFTVTAVTNPDGGSSSQANVTVTPPGTDMVDIATIDAVPPPPPAAGAAGPAAKNKFKVKGKTKQGSGPVPTKVTCKAYQVDVTTNTWTEVDSQDGVPNNGKWEVTLSYTQQAGFRYVARAFAYDSGGNLVGRFAKWNNK